MVIRSKIIAVTTLVESQEFMARCQQVVDGSRLAAIDMLNSDSLELGAAVERYLPTSSARGVGRGKPPRGQPGEDPVFVEFVKNHPPLTEELVQVSKNEILRVINIPVLDTIVDGEFLMTTLSKILQLYPQCIRFQIRGGLVFKYDDIDNVDEPYRYFAPSSNTSLLKSVFYLYVSKAFPDRSKKQIKTALSAFNENQYLQDMKTLMAHNSKSCSSMLSNLQFYLLS